jgi:amino acid adenylation domain-containing protein
MSAAAFDQPGREERERLLERLLAAEGWAAGAAQIPRRPDPDQAFLTRSQRRLWFLAQLPAQHVYNVPTLLDLEGTPDVPLLERCLSHVVQRHEVLRTVYPIVDGRPAAVIAPSHDVRIPVFDLTGLAHGDSDREARLLVVEESRRRFDLASGPLLRAVLIRLKPRESRLLLVMHHIACDWWSIEVLVRELATLYASGRAGLAAVLPELPLQFSDFAAWQEGWIEGEPVGKQLAFWKERLKGAPALELPADRPRPAVQSFSGRRFHFEVPAQVAGSLSRLCRESGATLFMGLLAAFDVLLLRHTGQSDLSVGTPISGRNRVELEGLIGYFLNTLVVRADLGGDPTFRELLAHVRDLTVDALANGDLPFEVLVDELKPARDLSRGPLFQVWFSLFQVSGDGGQGTGLSLSQEEIDFEISKFDLSLLMVETRRGLLGVFEYRTDLFEEATAERMASHFLNLLSAAAEDPDRRLSELPMLGAEERRRLLDEWNATSADYGPPTTLVKLFESQAARSPGATAVIAGKEELSYAELNSRANLLARRLRRLGVGPESVVGILAERSLEMVTGLLGILKAGGAYLPLDPDYPDDRLSYMLADSGCAVLLAQPELLPKVPSLQARVVRLGPQPGGGRTRLASDPAPAATHAHPAYVIYTSGSTGRPKGVVVEHAGISNRLLWMQEAFGLNSSDRVLQKTPFSFDVSVWEFFWPLITGATLVMARPGGHRDPAYLADLIAAQGVTTAHFVPSMLQLFLQEPGAGACRGLRRVICSGEALAPALVERFLERLPVELHNLYGPTEASVDVTHWPCRPLGGRAIVPIGRPIANVRLHVLDRDLEPAPVGVPGELLIGGVALARGYLGKPRLTAERFIADPFGASGQRLYRTGDLARYLPDGNIEFLGRLDHQVKLHGNRIELGEIEAVLAQHEGVRESAVVLREDVPGDPRLVAYVVPEERRPTFAQLRRHLKASLPAPMLPAAFVMLDELPLSSNGKLDRRSLPAPDAAGARPEDSYVAPRNHVEEVIAAAWAAVLKVDRVGIHDNFFALGGDSLKTVQVAGLAREHGVALSVEDLFQHQTVAELAAHARPLEGGGQGLPEPFGLISEGDRAQLPDDVEDAYPMTMLQAGMLLHMASEEEIPAYHNVTTLKVSAAFDSEAMQRAVDHAVARHAALRSSLHVTGYSTPMQLVHKKARLPVVFEDLRGLEPAEQEFAVAEFMQAQARVPLDLTRAPLLRLHVHRTETGFSFTVTECHPVLDGWSFTSLVSEILRSYSALLAGDALSPSAPSPPYQREFVRLEQSAMRSPEEQTYWEATLAGRRPQRLPRHATAVPAPDNPAGGRFYVPVGGDVAEGLDRLARAAAVPLSSVLLAAHLRALNLITGERKVVTGVVVHGRPEASDSEQARGLFLNVLPLSLDLTGGTWLDLVRVSFEAQAELLAHRHFPQASVQKAWAQRWGREPMYEVAFNYTHFYALEALGRLPNLELASTFSEIARTNLPLLTNFERGLEADGFGLMMSLEADGGVIPVERLPLLAETYSAVLGAMAADPSARYEPASPTRGGPRPSARRRKVGSGRAEAARPGPAILARVWADVLGLDQVRPADDFFELGGDSIRALQIIARLREAGLRLTPEEIFEHPTLAELGPLVSAAERPRPGGSRPSVPFALAGLSSEELATVVAETARAK